MSFIAKNPLTIPKASKAPSAPIQGTRGLFAKEDGWYDIDDSGNERKIISEDDLSAEIPEVVDNLTSKATDKALSANQGNKLEYSKISYDLAYDEKPGDLDNLVPEADTFYNTTDKWYYTTTRFGNTIGRIREYLYARNMQPVPLEATDKYNDALQIMIKGEDICKRVRTRHSNSNGSLTYTWSEWHPYLTGAEAFDKLCPMGSAESLTSSLTLTDGCGGTNVRNYVIHGAEGGVGDLNSATGKYEIPVSVRGKNLFSISRDLNYISSSYIGESGTDYFIGIRSSSVTDASPGAYNWSSGQVGFQNVAYGTATAATRFVKDLKPNTTYTFSCDVEVLEFAEGVTRINPRHTITVSGQSFNVYAGGVTEVNVKKHIKNTFTTGDEIGTVSFLLYLQSCKLKFSNPQIEEGSAETDFESYTEPVTYTIYLDEPLGAGETVTRETGGDITLQSVYTNIIKVGTTVAPGKIEVEYYKDINKVLANLNNAILSQGGNA